MQQISHLEIYRFLQKSNCRKCEFPTCLAFAAAVMRGEKSLNGCPYIDSQAVVELEQKLGPRSKTEDEREKTINQLRSQIRLLDLAKAAERTGASHTGNVLTVKCLSKDFHIDSEGNVRSDCHKTPWLIIPLLNYIIHSAGKKSAGKWVLFRELAGGADWGRLFGQRCEKPFKRLVDTHTDLFEYIIDIFDGKLVDEGSECDISVVVHPLPKVPVLIRYWKKEGDFDSALTLLFDATAEENLGIESLYTICVGLLTMFEKIALTHGTFS